ncbi:MAG: bifunctional 3-(3-hydroxy-phenyl)propionate/3-hydroxycinnamic acid hydroxylase [Blastocatellia bacterium]
MIEIACLIKAPKNNSCEEHMETMQTDILIIGCGPTGVVLANLLGQLGCNVIVLERQPDVYPIPRATHIDEETLRNFQTTGLMPYLLPHTTPVGYVDIVDENGAVLLEDKIEQANNQHGYAGSCFFDQPEFETILRDGLRRYANVTLHTGIEAAQIEEHDLAVTVRAKRSSDGAALEFRAAWVVGCDGGTSLTRDWLNIEMESLAPKLRWLIVDTLLKDMNDAALLPDRFRYVLDPVRLTIFAYGIGKNRRWEFQLGPDEEAPPEEEVRRWITPFIDPDKVRITRIAPYAHNSLVAGQWRRGRILLAGDAAHMMPPSAGQGMCSGIRDAINLAWKLAAVVQGQAKEELLDSYAEERKPHLIEILKGTLFISNRLQANSPFQRWRRRSSLLLMGAAPPPIQAALRHLSLRRVPLQSGFIDKLSDWAGRHLPQVNVAWQGEETKLDDVLGYRFSLLVTPQTFLAQAGDWGEARNITVWRVGEDLLAPELTQWMRDERLDYVLVRPDHQIFSAGDNNRWPHAQAKFETCWRSQ